jgi:hypothetical protein
MNNTLRTNIAQNVLYKFQDLKRRGGGGCQALTRVDKRITS